MASSAGLAGPFQGLVAQAALAKMRPDGTVNAPDRGRGFVIPSNFMRGLTRKGELFDLAKSNVGDGEFTGATWSPDGDRLFFNVQKTSTDVGQTYEVRGPFHKGPF